MELSTLAANIKSLIKWAGYSLLGLFFVWVFWLLISFTFDIIFPPPAETADEAFGKISRPFDNTPDNKDLVFDLETPGEKFPETPLFLPVFEIPPLEGRFTSLENGSQIARGGGLDSEPVKLNEPIWRWTNTKNPNQSLRLNVVTNNFTYTNDWVADPSILQGVFRTTDSDLVTKAEQQLSIFKSLKDDFKDGGTKVSYWKLEGVTRRQVGSLSEANAAMVEFFRKPVNFREETFPVVEANNFLSSVNVLLSPSDRPEKQLIEINFTYWGVDFENLGTYTLKTAQEAYDELKSGETYVATGNNQQFKKVTISNIYLAYFNPLKETRVFQPVYVFKGEGSSGGATEEFVSYVPAILNEYLK